MSRNAQDHGPGHAIFASPVRRSLSLALQSGLPARPAKTPPPPTFAYAAASDTGKGSGIYQSILLTENLEVSQNVTLAPPSLAAELPHVAFLAVALERRLLLGLQDSAPSGGQREGAVSCYSIDPRTGSLSLLSRGSSMGAGPCHAIFDQAGKFAFVSHGRGGTVSVFPVQADGKLAEVSHVVQVAAPGSHQGVQGLALDPVGGQLLVCDPARNGIAVYRFDAAAGKLAPAEQPFVTLKEASAPRRAVFHPGGKFAYVVSGTKSIVTALSRDVSGKLGELRSAATVPEYYDGPNACTEIGIHPTGRFLYVANRGHNSLVLFNIDEGSGELAYVEEQGTGGKNPWHFGIEPSAKHLVIANRDSNQLLVSRIDDGNGRLKPSGVFVDLPAPQCVLFVPAKESAA